MDKQTHQILDTDTFDWVHAQNLLNFGDKVKRVSTGLILDPKENWHVTEEDKKALDWQHIPPESHYE